MYVHDSTTIYKMHVKIGVEVKRYFLGNSGVKQKSQTYY